MNAEPSRFKFTYNDVWNNAAGDYKDIENLTGINGNVSADPKFNSNFDFKLKEDSPLLNAGNPSITNPDGSRSNIGIDGGQSVK